MAKTKDEVLAALQSIMDEAGESNVLTDDQCSRYEQLETELKSIEKSDEIQKRNAAYNSVRTPALVTGSIAKQDDTLDRAFNHYLRTGRENQDVVQLRAQSEGTASAGGFTVPDGFRNKLVDRMKAFGGIANVSETVTTSTGNPLEWPTIDDTANSGAIVAENGAPASGADLVFGTATLGAYKYMSVGASNAPLKVSVELLQDSAFDVESLVARKLGERIARAAAPHFVSGTGSGQPKGIITGKTVVEAALTYAGLVSVIHSLDPAYRENAVFAMNDATLAQVHSLVDGNGRPLLNTSTDGVSGRPAMSLLGYPIVIDQAFGTYVAGDADPAVGVFGDLREGYVIRRVRDLQVVVDPYSFAINGQVGFTAWERLDATQQNPNSYVAFAGDAA